MRSFVSIELPPARRQELHGSLDALRERGLPVRWTQPDALHLTLRFLGEIEGVEVARIDDALRGVAPKHRPLALRIGGLGAFPSLRRANILWIGIAADPHVMALQRDVELALARLGYGREQKPFRPHITVARARSGARPPDIERLVTAYTWTGTVDVAAIHLMRSHTGAEGARYEPLLRVPLGAEHDA